MADANDDSDGRSSGPWIAFRVKDWARLGERLTPELEGYLARILVRMVSEDEPFPADPDKARYELRVASRGKAERILNALEELGILTRVEDGFTFEFAKRALDDRRRMFERNRQNARGRTSTKLGASSGQVRGKHDTSANTDIAEKANKSNEAIAPVAPLPHHTTPKEEEESSSYPTESPNAAREGSSNLIPISIGLGRGGAVTIEGRRRVCKLLNIGDAEPLVAIYEQWPESRNARNPDALFATVAPKLLGNAPPEVQRACQPLNGRPADVPAAPHSQPSPGLRAKLATRGDRYART